jgi:hypothetical protein
LIFAILIGGLTYALLQVQHNISSSTVVGKIGVTVYEWQSDTAYGAEKTTQTWGMTLIGEAKTAVSELLVWKNTGDEPIKLLYSTDLANNLGLHPIWQIEVCVQSGASRNYVWVDIGSDGSVTWNSPPLSGSGALPKLQVGDVLGFRPSVGSEVVIDPSTTGNLKAYGNLRMALKSDANCVEGSYSWIMSAIGEEVA